MERSTEQVEGVKSTGAAKDNHMRTEDKKEAKTGSQIESTSSCCDRVRHLHSHSHQQQSCPRWQICASP